jgi:integrase
MPTISAASAKRNKRVNITTTFVERVKLPTSGEEFYRDIAIRGFALRVNWGGTKSFALEVRVKGRPRRITIGRYPDVALPHARRTSLEWKSIIANGGDPTIERERERHELTFKDLTERYIEHYAKPHKASWKRDVARIEAHFTAWKGRRLSDIAADEVVKLHHEIALRRGKVAANRAMTLLRAVFNLARDWRLFSGENPTAAVKFFPEPKRERFLSPEELRRVNQALAYEPNEYWRAYFPLTLMLGPRRSELLAARWADIDLDQRTWRMPTTKAGRSHLLPLSEPAVTHLASLPSRGSNDWVFPGSGKTGHLVEPKSAWQRIRERAGVPDVTVHDLRRTLGSWLAGAGYSLPMIGKALNHSSPSSTAVYARLALDPVREMLEQNAAKMFGPGK